MAATTLPDFPPFDVNADPTSLAQRWKKWTARYENLLTALDIKDPARKKALLLHYTGQDVHDIYDTLPSAPATAAESSTGSERGQTATTDEYTVAKAKLDAYFMPPQKNVDYETYVFRQARQRQGETLDMFQSRLRQLAATCEFENVDREVKAQIVSGCSSSRLHRKALRDPKASLNDLLDHGRALETSESQASGMERQITTEVNWLSLKSSGGKSRPHQHKKTQKNNRCRCCGGRYPHKNGKTSCPAYGTECHNCGKPNHYARYCMSSTEGASSHKSNSSSINNEKNTG